MSYSVSVIYSIDKTYLKGSSGSADASATATYSGYDGTWPSSSNWSGYKVISVSSSVELKNWMSSTEATVKAYIGDTKVGEFDIGGGN